MKQSVKFNTNNEQSKIFVDNEELGEGNNVSSKIEKTGSKQVILKTPDYKDEYNVLLPERRVIAFWPLKLVDICFILPIGIDALVVEKIFKYPDNNEFTPKLKYRTRTLDEKYIDLEGVRLKVENKSKDINSFYLKHSENLMDDIKKIEKKREEEILKAENNRNKSKKTNYLNTEEKEINYENTKVANSIYNMLNKINYIDTVNQVFLDNNNTLALEGVIKKYSNYYITAKGLQRANGGLGTATYSYAKAKINIVWYLKNSYGEKLDSISDESFSGEFGNSFIEKKGFEPVYGDAAEISLHKLMENSRFSSLIKLDTNFNIADPKLDIRTPVNVVMNANDAISASVIIKRKDNKGHGSGFAISNDGYILTNYHVIADDLYNKTADIIVVNSSGEEIPVKVVRFNKMRDVALLKVDATFEKAFLLGSVKSYKKLMEVYTVGTPKSTELGQTISAGILSNERKRNNNDLLQLNININLGNSGGPLFDKTGILHGVVTSKLVGKSTEGIAFAIPSYNIQQYLNLNIK